MESYGYKTATLMKNTAIIQTTVPKQDKEIEEQKMLCGIIGLIVKPKYIKDALVWLKRSNSVEQKGLKIIAKVVKYKGDKPFKLSKNRIITQSIHNNDISLMTIKDVRLELNRRNLKSCYETFYGRKHNLTNLGDIDILKFNFFSELPSIRIININTQNCLDKWQEKEKDDNYISCALTTIRSLYTFVFGQPHNQFKKFKEANKPISRRIPQMF